MNAGLSASDRNHGKLRYANTAIPTATAAHNSRGIHLSTVGNDGVPFIG